MKTPPLIRTLCIVPKIKILHIPEVFSVIEVLTSLPVLIQVIAEFRSPFTLIVSSDVSTVAPSLLWPVEMRTASVDGVDWLLCVLVSLALSSSLMPQHPMYSSLLHARYDEPIVVHVNVTLSPDRKTFPIEELFMDTRSCLVPTDSMLLKQTVIKESA